MSKAKDETPVVIKAIDRAAKAIEPVADVIAQGATEHSNPYALGQAEAHMGMVMLELQSLRNAVLALDADPDPVVEVAQP